MPVTGLRGRQILDGDVLRNDLNITTSGSAVTRRIIAGTNIGLSSTGVDTGTGDVTINATGLLPLSGGTLTGNLIFANGTSPNTAYIQFGDGTGWVLRMMTNLSGTPTARFSFRDDGTLTATGQYITTRANFTGDGLGQIFLNGTNGNRIDWNAQGVAAPSLTTRSVGTKLVLYPAVSSTLVDYALGIESDTMWFSVAANGGSFKWYGGTQLNMHLSGQNLVVGTGSVSSRITTYSSAAGQIIDGITIITSNTSVSLGHASKFHTDTLSNGLGRTLIYAASYNTTNTSGQLDVITENGALFISRLGIGVTGATNTYSIFNTSGIESFRFNTNGDTFLNGGRVAIGNTSSPSALYLYNTNDSIPDYQITHQSASATLPTSSPIIITNTYNNGSNGHNLFITSTTATGSWEYNITKTWGGILTFGMSNDGTSVKRDLYIYSSGQIRLPNYNSTTSFTGTAVGVLAFTSDGSIITIATPGGGSGLTGSGTNNYVSKFTSGTSLGNSLIFDDGTNVGIGTITPNQKLEVSGDTVRFRLSSTTAPSVYYFDLESRYDAANTINMYGAGGVNFFKWISNTGVISLNPNGNSVGINTSTPDATLHVAGAVNSTQSVFGNISGRGLAIQTSIVSGTNDAGSILNARGAGGGALIVQTDSVERFRVTTTLQSVVPITITTGTTDTTGDSFSFTGVQGKTFVSISKLGFIRSVASETNGANIHFFDNGISKRTELAVTSSIVSWYSDALAANFMEWNHLTGQIRLNRYTATNSFTGTLVGYLGFTSTGQIITTAAPSGSSQWTTSGTTIFYTGGNVGIGSTFGGATVPTAILDVRMPTSSNGAIFQSLLSSTVGSTPLTINSNDTWQTIFQINNSTSRNFQFGVTGSGNTPLGSGHFGIYDGTALAYRMSINPSGQIRFQGYTSTTSFTGTAVGVLAFTSNGSLITIATPTGSSQWITNGSDIYYNTGNVGIGATTPLARLHFSTASTSVSNYIRFTNPVGSIYAGQVSNLNWFEIGIPGGNVWFQLKDTGQLRLNQYTAFNSFQTADGVGSLQFDANGNIVSAPLPIYRVAFVSGAPITLNNVPSAVQFFNNSNSYITRVDMTGKKRARLVGRVTTSATGGTVVRVRYRTVFSTTASDYLQMGTSEIQIPISSNGQFESNWIDLVAGARADVLVALQTIGGDGSTDPVVSQIHLEIED